MALKWVERLKYLGIWFVSGRTLRVDVSVNCTKFLGSVLGILQKCSNISDELKWHVVNHSCLPMLFYGIDSIILCAEQRRKVGVVCNNAVRRCFGLLRSTSVRNVLFYMGCMPINYVLDERRVLLMKECQQHYGVLGTLAQMTLQSNAFNTIAFTYDVHCDMSKVQIKNCFKDVFYNALKEDILV